MGEFAVEFSLLGQYDAAVKFANSLKLSKRSSDIPIVVLPVKSVKSVNVLYLASGTLGGIYLSIATGF
jgi:hypothetical protein